jgi:hypothetical protein
MVMSLSKGDTDQVWSIKKGCCASYDNSSLF